MEQLFAVKKDETVFRFYIDAQKQLIGIVSGKPGNIPVRSLLKFLVKKGVKKDYVDVKSIRQIASAALSLSPSGTDEERFIIARPRKPEPHDDFTVTFTLDPSQTPECSVGDEIGRIEKNTNGTAGEDIFGDTLEPPKQNKSILSRLDNMTVYEEKGVIISDVDGHLVAREGDAYAVLGLINLFLDEDKMTAYVALCSKKEISADNIHNHLQSNNITYGIDNNAVNLLAMRTKSSRKRRDNQMITTEKIPVTRGKPFKETQQGYIDWKINPRTEIAFTEDEHGNIDLKETSIITSVKKGDVIAVAHQPKEGKPGVTVEGEAVTPAEAKPIRLLPGKGVSNEERFDTFVAETEGIVSFDKNTLSVYPLYKVDGSVDYNTGNIAFEGSIEIKKDILPGFKVSAQQGITVGGTVEGAMLNAEDTIHIKNGIPGKETGRIIAKKDLITKYISECNVTTGKNLIVSSSITDTDITCHGSVVCTGGTLVGGDIFANRGIICKNVGTDISVKTPIEIGGSQRMYNKYKTLTDELLELKHNLLELEKKIEENKGVDHDLGKTLAKRHEYISDDIQQKEHKIDEISNGYELQEPAFKLVVLNRIYPGIIVTMKKRTYTVKMEMSGPLLMYYNAAKEAVDVRNLAKSEIKQLTNDFCAWLEHSEGSIE